MNLEQLLQQYSESLKVIRTNRKQARVYLERNKREREKFNHVKEQLRTVVTNQMESGKSLYEICMDNFGVIDRRFHVLYELVGKQ